MPSSPSSSPPAHSPATRSEQSEIVAHFQQLDANFLGNAELDTHFFAASDGKDGRNVKYEVSPSVPFVFHLFGVLLGKEQGSSIDAVGNYNAGDGAYFKPMRDGNIMGRYAKDTHAIGIDQRVIAQLAAHFNNQIATLNSVDENLKTDDARKGLQPPVNVYDWVKSSDGTEVDIILINSANKYGKPSPADSAPITAVRRTTKVNVESATESTLSDAVHAGLGSKLVGTAGAWYDPAVQPDFGGPFFALRDDKLRQQNIYDSDGDLVHPTRMYDVLRPGTLMEYICQLHVFNIENKNSRTPGTNRYCQIQFSEAHVLLESDEPAYDRLRRGVPPEYTNALQTAVPRTVNGIADANFQTFAQKRRAKQRLSIAENPEQPPPRKKNNGNSTTGSRTKAHQPSEKAKGKRKEQDRTDDDDKDMNVD